MGPLRSVGWAAVGASVTELLSTDILAPAVAEPHAPAPTAEQQLAFALATCVARAHSVRHQRSHINVVGTACEFFVKIPVGGGGPWEKSKTLYTLPGPGLNRNFCGSQSNSQMEWPQLSKNSRANPMSKIDVPTTVFACSS